MQTKLKQHICRQETKTTRHHIGLTAKETNSKTTGQLKRGPQIR